MVATGTRAELAKKRMNMGRMADIWAVCGSLTAESDGCVETHVNA